MLDSGLGYDRWNHSNMCLSTNQFSRFRHDERLAHYMYIDNRLCLILQDYFMPLILKWVASSLS